MGTKNNVAASNPHMLYGPSEVLISEEFRPNLAPAARAFAFKWERPDRRGVRGPKVVPAIQSVEGSAEAVLRKLAAAEALVPVENYYLEILLRRGHTGEPLQFSLLEVPLDDVSVCVAWIESVSEARLAVVARPAVGQQECLGLGRARLTFDGVDSSKLRSHLMARVFGATRHHQQYHFVRVPSGHPQALAAEVGAVDPHTAAKRMLRVVLPNCGHDLEARIPGGAVVRVARANQREQRLARLDPACQVQGQKPGQQGQLEAAHSDAGHWRRLFAVSLAQMTPLGAVADNTAHRRVAPWTRETHRLAHLRQRRCALCLSALAQQRLHERNSELELSSVRLCQGSGNRWRLKQSLAHWMSLAELWDESVKLCRRHA